MAASTEKDKPKGKSTPNLWLHVKILYISSFLLTVALVAAVFVGLREIQKLRSDLDGHLAAPRTYVEFEEHSLQSEWERRRQEAGLGPLKHDGGPEEEFDDKDIDETEEGDDEQLIRVKRRTHRRRSREGKHRNGGDGGGGGESNHAPPSFYYEQGQRPGPGGEDKEGGSGSPDPWVWLTSYSRIPMFALQEFCSATTKYCPAAPPGPPGLDGLTGYPGEKGEPGEPGEPGNEGERGEPGEPGEKGEQGEVGFPGPEGSQGHTGEKGDQGFNGTDGLPGPKGEKGDRGFADYQGTEANFLHKPCTGCPRGPPGPPGPPGKDGVAGSAGIPGFNGTDGERGRRGRKGDPGLPGAPGPEGSAAATANCSCSKGQKGDSGGAGEKGERGIIGFIGYKGEPGDAGPPGPPGEGQEGPPGPQGPMGPRGMRGEKGEKGEQGRRYVTGSNMLLLTTTPEPTTTTLPTTTVEPTIADNKKNCRIKMIGKPLFRRYTSTFYGAFMRDPFPPDGSWGAKVWSTRHFTGKFLTEYSTYENFRHEKESRKYTLPHMYLGTGHVVYEGAFYYHRVGENTLLKYDLKTQRIAASLTIPNAVYEGKETTYSTDYTFFDLTIDLNGLWVIYSSRENRSVLLVSKLDHVDLTIEKTWKILVDHHRYGNGFITCGVLYLIRDTQSKTTVIDFAYDLYKKQVREGVRLKFTNPFQMNNMVSYNPKEKRIYSWDKGNLLTYPLLLESI